MPVASTGYARDVAFSFLREGGNSDVDEKGKSKMKCNVPVDRETRIALVGDALEDALKDPTSPRCGQELTDDDVFCPACGARVENKFSSQFGFPTFVAHCKGRASRSELWGVWMIAVVFYAFVYGAVFSIAGNDRGGFGSLPVIVGFMIGICTLPVAVRRLHDRGNSGKAMIPSVCLSFVSTVLVLTGNAASITGSNASFACALVDITAAAYNLFLFVALGFIRGTKGPNKYGPDPLETK